MTYKDDMTISNIWKVVKFVIFFMVLLGSFLALMGYLILLDNASRKIGHPPASISKPDTFNTK